MKAAAAQVEKTRDAGAASAAWYRSALDALEGEAAIGLDADGRICVWTDAARRLTGYKAAEMLGQPYDNLAAASGGPSPGRVLRSVLESGRCETARWWRRADASLFWAQESITPAPDTADGEKAYTLIVRDASELHAARDQDQARSRREQEAHDREGQLRSELQVAEWRAAFLAEASSILVASSLDFDGTIKGLARLAVSRLCEWCVVHALDAEGRMRRLEVAHRDPRREKAFSGTVAGAPPSQAHSPVMAVLRTGAGQIVDQIGDPFFAALADDPAQVRELRDFGATTAMIVPLLGRGRVLGTVTLVDVTDGVVYDEEDLAVAEELARRAAIAIDNARLYREAQEANRAKADFLAIMSHELRTPLNAIMGYSDLLDAEISGPVLPKQRRQLGRIRASARHLLQLIEEILAFARMEEGGEEVALEEVDAGELAREAAAAVEPLATAKGIALEVAADTPLALRTDASKVRQILVNLLSNAIKFTERGSVRLSTASGQGSLVFTVADTGIGITPEQIERIFEPFWQVERPTTRRAGGTGLGLSVSRRFARLLGGDIHAQSVPGEGTTFRVELPVSSVQLQRRNPPPAANDPAATGATGPGRSDRVCCPRRGRDGTSRLGPLSGGRPGAMAETFRFSPRPNRAHAIAWQPWRAATFEAAARQDRLVFLNLTVPWCASCHQLDETTLSDTRVIELLNTQFVPMRVDADRMPHVQERYIAGGWPTCAFLTPTGELLWSGTFIEASPLVAMAAQVLAAWSGRRAELQLEIERRQRALEAARGRQATFGLVRREAADDVISVARETVDPRNGGFGGAPKFPLPAAVEMMYLRASRGEPDWLPLADLTLDGMLAGDLLDRVDGGFYRYALEADWTKPRREKLLEANAGLLRAYALGAHWRGREDWAAVAERTVGWVDATLGLAGGLWGGSQFADDAYFEGHAAARAAQGRPPIDDTVYADATAQWLAALAEAGGRLGRSDWIARAESALIDLLDGLGADDDRMYHYRAAGEAPAIDFLLKDTLHAAVACLAVAQVTGRADLLAHARRLAAGMERGFWADEGGFNDRARHTDEIGLLRYRDRPFELNAEAARFFIDLAGVTGERGYRGCAERILAILSPAAGRYGVAAAAFAIAADEFFHPPRRVFIVGDAAASEPLRAAALGVPGVDRRVFAVPNGSRIGSLHLRSDAEPAAFVCDLSSCSPPLGDPAGLTDVLARAR